MPARPTAFVRRLSVRARPCWWMLCCALVAGGCANCQLPRLDPSGDRIFLPPGAPSRGQTPGALAAPVTAPLPAGQWGISVSPSQVIAPVGSEVVMIASVCGSEGFMLTNQRVEWMLAPDGAGQFMSPGERRPLDIVDRLHGLPAKIDSRYVINTTLFSPMTLDRGTPTPLDDVLVQSGQSWVSVTSPSEGTSRVTVFAPTVFGWDRRQQTASIYWVDAQWRFPSPGITPVGSRKTLTTVLTRQTDNSPLPLWHVRYEITSGPDAGFAPDGTTSLEIPTGETGEATVEIFQKQPSAGTNQINIQVIRPAGVGGQNRSLPVGSGSTLQTWTSAEPAIQATGPPQAEVAAPIAASPPAQPPAQIDVAIVGPTTAVVGSDAQFEVRVINRGAVPARQLLVTDRFDAGLQHAVAASPIERNLDDLQPGGMASFAVTLQVTQPGELCQDVEVTGEGGLRAAARSCVTAIAPAPQPPPVQTEPTQPPAAQPTPAQPPAQSPAVSAPVLSVKKTGPDRRRVGETAEFTIDVTNGGQNPIEELVITDNYETSLRPEQATEGFEQPRGQGLVWRIGRLAPGKTIRRKVVFSCQQETLRACNRVTATAAGIPPMADEACLEIVAQQAPAAAPAAPAAPPPPNPPMTVSVAETADPIKVGGETTYQILIGNIGSQPEFDVVVAVTLSDQLRFEGSNGPERGTVGPKGVRFGAIKELRAGESPLSYEIRATGVRPGTARFHVEVTSRGQPKPVSADQTTQVLP
ncbi:MAG: DUF11 domain-containing protein [Planctomycetia bacterium]|nr:DUF11 domain-containing protein [Planctomycetia bacterium]